MTHTSRRYHSNRDGATHRNGHLSLHRHRGLDEAAPVPDAFFPFADPRETAARVLDEATVERALAEGAAMTLEEALAYAREDA